MRLRVWCVAVAQRNVENLPCQRDSPPSGYRWCAVQAPRPATATVPGEKALRFPGVWRGGGVGVVRGEWELEMSIVGSLQAVGRDQIGLRLRQVRIRLPSTKVLRRLFASHSRIASGSVWRVRCRAICAEAWWWWWWGGEMARRGMGGVIWPSSEVVLYSGCST